MALASAAAENAAANGITALCAAVSLHTASPGTTGANEVSGGSYARQSETWGSASAGSAANTNTPSVPCPASTTVTHVGHWSATSAGTYEIGAALGSSITTGSTATIVFSPGSLTVAAA